MWFPYCTHGCTDLRVDGTRGSQHPRAAQLPIGTAERRGAEQASYIVGHNLMVDGGYLAT